MSRLRGLLCAVGLLVASISCRAAESIAFLRLAPTGARLYVAASDGSAEHALTQPGSLNYNPSWSPKGDWIAFTSEREGSADLFRMHPDGSGLERLTDDPAFDDQAGFSPDEKQIVFVSTRAAGFANLWVLDLATHKARPLTSGRGGDFRPAWSPDGEWIAFSSDRESSVPAAKGRWERLHLVDIFLIHPDGSGLKRISQHGDFCGSPRWSTDSKSVVAYCMSAQETWSNRFGYGDGNNKLVRLDMGGGSSPVSAGPGVKLAPSFLPSGAIAYLRRDKDAHGVFYADGSKGPAGDDIRNPSWSPDGKQVVYSRIAVNRPIVPAKLWSRNRNFDLYATRWLPAYDPSGADLATTLMNPDNSSSSLVVVDSDGDQRTLLKQEEKLILAPAWSPDGKRLAFGIGIFSSFLDSDVGDKKPFEPVNGGAQVGILNADGSGFHLVTSGPNNNAFPWFSPDGKRIVYRTMGPNGEQGLRILNLDDGSFSQLTTEWDNFPIWSPKGDRIAFVRRLGSDFEVFTIHPDGKDLTQLTSGPGINAHLAWSSDGERLLFASSRMGFKDEALYTGAPQPYGEIFVMNADGTHIEQLTDDQWEEGGPAWRPEPAVAQKSSSH